MSPITTHVLDTSVGRPAGGVHVILERRNAEGSFAEIGRGVTDGDGRLKTLLPDAASLEPGLYRLTFETGAYYAERGVEGFYPEVLIVFEVREGREHYHVPVLLSPWGYSTYRGS
jgi:5-hydroxyisourate hydrolase